MYLIEHFNATGANLQLGESVEEPGIEEQLKTWKAVFRRHQSK